MTQVVQASRSGPAEDVGANEPIARSFNRGVLERAQATYGHIIEQLGAETGWIDATKRDGRVPQEYLDFYNSTPSAQYAFIRTARDEQGEFHSRAIRHIENPWDVLEAQKLFELADSDLETIGVVYKGLAARTPGSDQVDPVQFSYELKELRSIILPAIENARKYSA